MNNDKPQPFKVQDTFLNFLRKNKTPLNVFLINGIRLQGILMSFDNFSFIIENKGSSVLVYKHCVSTIVPNNPVSAFRDSPQDSDETL